MKMTRDELTRLLFTGGMPSFRLDDGREGVLLAVEKEDGSGRCFNLTVRICGKGVTWGETIKVFARVEG